MEKVSIIFTRYNNDYEYLNLYPRDDGIEYILVDDGSEDDPVLEDHWKMYKITKDIGWNSEGAKNLGMHVMESNWGLTCDLDHPLLMSCLTMLKHCVNFLPKEAGYNPVRKDGKAINSYLMHKDFWWDPDINGYDESYSGYYGYDRTLSMAIWKKSAVLRLPYLKLDILGNSRSMTRAAKA